MSQIRCGHTFQKRKLIVAIRHPILWFESFYNFRTVDNKRPLHWNTEKYIGRCKRDEHVCTDHAQFHVYLSKLFENNAIDSGISSSSTPHSFKTLWEESKKNNSTECRRGRPEDQPPMQIRPRIDIFIRRSEMHTTYTSRY